MHSRTIFFVLLIFGPILAFTDYNYAPIYEYTKEDEYNFQYQCKRELNATDDDMKVLYLNDQMPKFRIQYCLLGCYYKKIQLLSPDNRINPDRVIQDIRFMQHEHKDLYEKVVFVIKDCSSIIEPSQDECIAAQQYFSCILLAISKLKFKPK